MNAGPGDRYAFELEIAVEAGRNFKARKKERDAKAKAIEKGDYTAAEGPERVAKRVNRLREAVKDAVMSIGAADVPAQQAMAASLSPAISALMQKGPVMPAELTNAFVEQVIGETRDFLAVAFFEKGTIASRAVCRIVTNVGAGRRGFGTGFLVTPRLLLTNNHVLKTIDAARASTAEFNYQVTGAGAVTPVERFDLKPDEFYLTDIGLDFALVAVAPRSATGTLLSTFGYLSMIAAEGKILVQDPVNIIQHPKGDLKQIVIRKNTLLDLPDQAPLDRYAHYEADTEPGSSGSPVFNDQWEVVALHHSSVPQLNAQNQILDRKGNVWPQGGDEDEISWISNEGIRTSRLVKFITEATVNGSARMLRDEFVAISSGALAPPAQPVNPVAAKPMSESTSAPVTSVSTAGKTEPRRPRPLPPAPHAPAPMHESGGVSLTIPLTVTVSVGAPLGTATAKAAPASEPLAEAEGLEASIQPDPDYANRPGFDPNFLGFPTPLPTLAAAVRDQAAPVESGGVELKYHHYSVIMNAERKVAFVSAVNLDGGAEFQLHREGKDRWFFDPRIEKADQVGNELYANNPLDRGHLTRRADAAWGTTEEEAQLANDDTFHWTNCSPQHEVFNQSTKSNQRGVLLWGNLENHVAEQAAEGGGKLCVFNGPIFRKNDRVHRGIRVPREFYKLIVYKKDSGQPGAVAFILSQQSLIKNLPTEDFEVGPYEPFQVKIADLQKRTNLDFGPFAGFDPLAAVGREAFMEGATADLIALEGLRDVLL
jgi:endonuclease G